MVAPRDRFTTNADALQIPWVHSPFFARQIETCGADEELVALARRYHHDGFVVLKGLVDDELVRATAGRYPWMFDPSTRFERAMDRPEVLADDPRRRQDAWTACDEVRAIARHPRVLEILRFFYRRRPIPFQTLNFIRGSEQPPHSDSIHFHSIPALYMCGVWVALEDVGDDNGPLCYYPGSHLLPVVTLDHFGLSPSGGEVAAGRNYRRYEQYVREVVDAAGLTRQVPAMKAGDGLIWSANLIHGGEPVRDPTSTRMSQVTHYYFDDCAYFAPIQSDVALGEYRAKEIHDIDRDRRVSHRLRGKRLHAYPTRALRVRFSTDPPTLAELGADAPSKARLAYRLLRSRTGLDPVNWLRRRRGK